jgi:hypothetical protein
MPIRLRLALIVSVIAALLVIGGGVLFTSSLHRGMSATLERALRQRAGRVDAQLVSHLLPLTIAGGPARPAPDQSLVQVVSTGGSLLYTTEAAGSRTLASGSAVGAARHQVLWIELRRPWWKNPRLLLAEPGPRGSGVVVVVGTSLDQVEDSTVHVERALLIGGPLVVFLCAAGAWVLAGRALGPVERLRAEAAEISANAPSGTLAVPKTHDELAALAETLNDLLARLHGSLSQQRHFVAAASHELRTPLAALRAALELAARPDSSDGDLRVALSVSVRRVDQLVQLSNRLLLMAQADEGVLAVRTVVQPVEPIVADALEAQRAHAEQGGVLLVLDAEPNVVAASDETLLREVVGNLIDNAIRHAPAGTMVDVAVRRDAGVAVVEIRDRGPGFPPDFLPHAFEPFSRPDPSRTRHRGGAGLGLAIVHEIVVAHGGTVGLTNHPEGGAVALVRLPAAGVGAEDPLPVWATPGDTSRSDGRRWPDVAEAGGGAGGAEAVFQSGRAGRSRGAGERGTVGSSTAVPVSAVRQAPGDVHLHRTHRRRR